MISSKTRKNKNKGFSLVELIVVIAIMAILTAILTPALLQYVEKSRAQKDDSAMGEVTNAVKIAMADQDVYDELLTVESGKDAKVPSGYADTTDEVAAKFAGEQRGVTITFRPVADNRKSVITMADGYINAGAKDSDAVDTTKSKLGALTAGDGKYHMIGALENICGKEITLVSQTYRNSDYTIFIKMGTLGAADSAIAVEGEWNDTNLPKNAANGGTGGDEGNGGDDGDEIPVTYAASFAENDWGVIANACQKNEVPATWAVGNTKAMVIDGTEYNVVIIGKDHDTYTNGGTAPLTFQLVECPDTKVTMNTENTNSTGWSASEMRTTTLVDVLAGMPVEVQNAIKAVDKSTIKGGGRDNPIDLETTSDKLFLLSEYEVFGAAVKSGGVEEGSQYAFYKNGGDKIKNYKSLDEYCFWRLRTPLYDDEVSFAVVNAAANVSYFNANYDIGLAFGFCF